MVGHTGNINAAIKAIESLDNCVSVKLLNAVKESKGSHDYYCRSWER